METLTPYATETLQDMVQKRMKAMLRTMKQICGHSELPKMMHTEATSLRGVIIRPEDLHRLRDVQYAVKTGVTFDAGERGKQPLLIWHVHDELLMEVFKGLDKPLEFVPIPISY